MQTPALSKDNNEKSNNAGLLLNMTLGVLSLGFLLALPSGILAWFDGLPWTGEAETLVLSVIIPFLLILRWRFLSFRFSILFLCALLFLKVFLFMGSPSSGLLVKVHPNLTQGTSASLYGFKTVEDDNWVKTYATLWNKNASAVLRSSWDGKLDFPLDWVLLLRTQCVQESGVSKGCFEALSAIIEIEGALLIPKGRKFALIAKGVTEGTLIAENELGNSFVLTPSRNLKEAVQLQYQLPTDGRWKISGKLSYAGSDWSLVPVLVENDGQVTKDLGRDVLWQNVDDLLSSSSRIGLYKFLSMVVDGGLVIFLLAWIVSTITHMIQKQVLNFPLAILSVSAVCIPYVMAPFLANVLRVVRLSDPTSVSYIGISIVITGIGFLFWTQRQKDYRNFQDDRIIPSIFLLFGPALLFFFSNKWWPSLGQWKNWGAGDDWVSYQLYARKIVVEGEWLNAGEGVFTMMPFYRYIIGIYHWLFGQSAFVQNMADVWCILGATILIAGFAIKFRISPLIIFITGISYLSINLLGAFRYHIGLGLVEYHAMILMILAAWFLYRSREGGTKPIVLATLFGILGYWTRQDHLGAIVCLAFLVVEPVTGPTGGWKGYWDRFQIHWKKIAVYWGLGISSVLLICFRHWWLGGAFYPTRKNHPNLNNMDAFTQGPKNIYLTITTNHWPQFPNLSGSMATFGVLIALLALFWRPKVLKNFPLSLPITIVGLLLPYAFIHNWGYAPRYSIHLMPLALLSAAFFLSNFLGRFKLLSKFYSHQN